MKHAWGIVHALAGLCLGAAAHAEPLPRPTSAAGSVIARKSGEEVRFVDVSSWRYVDLRQDLLGGDVLRTNANGQLAVLFSDRTQVRLGRNTSLLVKSVGSAGSDTGLELQSGTIWARAERGGEGVRIDTPAAAAAIRGTDWTMTVGADGKTSLIVLEGLVELSNAYGTVQVAQGEGAVAAIGSAPSKIVIARPKDREQMLFHLSLRDAFQWMPPTPFVGPQMRAERGRVEAKAEEMRSAEEWLSLAEIYMTLDGKQKAAAALARARAGKLGASQQARADLVDALIAGRENRYADAARLFEKAKPRLDRERRAMAAYGGYFARSLGDPNHVEEPPEVDDSGYAAIAKAWTAGFRENLPAAIEALKAGERANPDNPMLPATRAQVATLLAEDDEARDGFERALSLDPDDPWALIARGEYRLSVLNDSDSALADLERATVVSPGVSLVWNQYGLAQADRDANQEAEAAFRRAIELDPLDPLPRANLATLYLNQMRMAEARREIDTIMAIDPSYQLALYARGLYHYQSGDVDKAIDDMLAASVANPGYSNLQLGLGAILYEKGDRIAAAQTMDNAERLDPNDPVVPVFRTAIAIDEYDADEAIRSAQEVMRLTRARGGDAVSLGANQQAGSTLNDAFQLQGLGAWGQYYADAIFDPFKATSFIDQAVRGSVNPFANAYSHDATSAMNSQNSGSQSAFIQGLMLDPHMLASRERSANLLRRPFVEAAIGGGVTVEDGKAGLNAQAEIRALTMTPYPISFYGNIEWNEPRANIGLSDTTSYDREIDILGANGYFAQSITPDDRIVAYANYSQTEDALDRLGLDRLFPDGLLSGIAIDTNSRVLTSGLAWSHTVSYHNVVNAALLYTDQAASFRSTIDYIGEVEEIQGRLPLREVTTNDFSEKTYIAALNHTVETGDVTWRYGVEGGFARSRRSSHREIGIRLGELGILPLNEQTVEAKERAYLGLAYIDALYEITPDLAVEGAVFGRYVDGNEEDFRIEPRLGIAWAPTDGHYLRAGFMREGNSFDAATLSPIGIVQLQPNQVGLEGAGYVDTFAARWDAEWNERLFTALDYQHQKLNDATIATPFTNEAYSIGEGTIDRVALTGNLALGHGFGLSATAAYIASDNDDPAAGPVGGSIPFIPDRTAQVALTWVSTANVKATIAANYTGERRGDPAGNAKLDDYWTLDAALTWEPFDKRMEIELSAFNLLDEDFEVEPGFAGWGPSFKGTMKVRF